MFKKIFYLFIFSMILFFNILISNTYALDFPKGFLDLLKKEEQAISKNDYDSIIQYSGDIIKMFNESIMQEKDLIIAPRFKTIAQAYEAKKDYRNSLNYFKLYQPIAEKLEWFDEVEFSNQKIEKFKDAVVSITISAVGDCTLGIDDSYPYAGSFIDEFYKQNKNYGYFFQDVKDVFSTDDLTIINLETTLTTATQKVEKDYNFKGLPEFTKIIQEGNIEVPIISNNHTYDYLQKGYNDTKKNLKEANIDYFGNEVSLLKDVNGIKVGMFGFRAWNDNKELRNNIKNSIEDLRSKGAEIVIASFHWGKERVNYTIPLQNYIGRYTIDCGADLVLGHHPHVLQGIELYKNKFIVYSLANFSFGGSKNSADKDTMIFRQTFSFKGDTLLQDNNIQIIPAMVSSLKHRNDYKPIIAKGIDRERITNRIIEYSGKFSGIDIIKKSFYSE